jgi:HD-GYP domain-containing protein (c-di-GMP phosphodiesterase class II)
VELAMSIASQAAVALENYALYKNIRMLFDDFVSAAVTVIESRDPSTAGHSERVARLTVTLAEACSASDEPVFSDVQYSPRGLEELRYASLLHDFGKVGVREEVLLKANKLYPWELERIEWRFRVASVQATLETDFRELSGKGPSERKDLLGHDLHVIREMNKPNYQFQNEDVDQIQGIAQRWSLGDSGEPTLDQAEVTRLCIPYGSLDPLERKEIERHVEHTYQFLRLIPWTEDLQGVPDIAHAHHEKLDGSGYPLGLAGTKIPYGAKLMAISDIFDALTASDRPYKPALGEGKAISILRSEAERQHLEHEAVELFVGARLWERAGITLTLS